MYGTYPTVLACIVPLHFNFISQFHPSDVFCFWGSKIKNKKNIYVKPYYLLLNYWG